MTTTQDKKNKKDKVEAKGRNMTKKKAEVIGTKTDEFSDLTWKSKFEYTDKELQKERSKNKKLQSEIAYAHREIQKLRKTIASLMASRG